MGNVFPDQQVTKWFKYSTASIGCWTTPIALQVAEELKRDGFKVRVRGRGHRPKRKTFNPYDYVPLTEATHAQVYIIESHWNWKLNRRVQDVEILEKKDIEPEPLDPRVEALIATVP